MSSFDPSWLVPNWPAPAHVQACCTTRLGGVSQAPFASFNLGDHVGDDPLAVAENRRLLSLALPNPPHWLTQTHSTQVNIITTPTANAVLPADASVTQIPEAVCVVMTADCLPLLLTDQQGTVVAAVHAGWRGLCDGIIERTVAAMAVPATTLLAWLGPAIGPNAFEVGAEVRAAFVAQAIEAEQAFIPQQNGKYLADIYQLARQRLQAVGVSNISGGTDCTVTDSERFFSYRRDGQTGRMASCIWISAGTTELNHDLSTAS